MAVVQIMANEHAELRAENRRLREEIVRLNRRVAELMNARIDQAAQARGLPAASVAATAAMTTAVAREAPRDPDPDPPAKDDTATRFSLLELD